MIKSALRMATMFALMSELDVNHGISPTPEISPEIREELHQKWVEKTQKKKGLTLFYYGENSLWALNQKNADRKARKKGWIK